MSIKQVSENSAVVDQVYEESNAADSMSKRNAVIALIGIFVLAGAAMFVLTKASNNDGSISSTANTSTTSSDASTTNNSSTNNSSSSSGSESSGICTFGTDSVKFSNACDSPIGLTSQLTGDPSSAMTYAGAGVFYVQYIVKNTTNAPLTVEASSVLKTSDGKTYNAMRTDDPFNPGGICQYAFSTWTVNLNPDAYSELGACFALDDGTSVGELDAITPSGSQVVGLRLNQTVSSN